MTQGTDGAALPLTKAALIKQHKHHWPTIERDLKDAHKNGLGLAAKANKERGWIESKALAWARSKDKLTDVQAPEVLLTHAIKSMSSSSSRQHRL